MRISSSFLVCLSVTQGDVDIPISGYGQQQHSPANVVLADDLSVTDFHLMANVLLHEVETETETFPLYTRSRWV